MNRFVKMIAVLLTAAICVPIAGCVGSTVSETTEAQTTKASAETTAEGETADMGTEPAEKLELSVAALAGPTGMGMAKLMSDDEAGACANDYSFTIYSAPDEITAEIIKGTVDIAAVPVNLASVLYAKTSGAFKIAAVNTLGVLYMLENGDTIHSVEDLRGKTIYATGQGSTPEYILNYILTANNISPETDVTIEWKTEHSELASLLASGDVVLGMLPEPQVTVAMNGNPDLRVALNMTEEWGKVSETKLIQGCIIINSQFAENHPEAVAAFLDEYKASVDYVNANNEEASALIENYGILAKAALAKTALPNCNITFISGEEMKTEVKAMLDVLYNANPASIGGAVPDDAIYYVG